MPMTPSETPEKVFEEIAVALFGRPARDLTRREWAEVRARLDAHPRWRPDDAIDGLVSATEAAAVIGVSVAAIGNWSTRGYRGRDGTWQFLPVAGRSDRNRRMYRLLDVAIAEHATRGKARRRSFGQAVY